MSLLVAAASPLVAPPPAAEKAQPNEAPSVPSPGDTPAPSDQGPAPASPGTGIPLIDRLLTAFGGGQPLDVSQWPVLKPGEPRPVLGFQFDYSDFLNATYFKEETLRGFVRQAVGKPLDTSVLVSDAEFMTLQYKLRGFTRARVTYSVEETERGDIVTFHLEASSRAQVRAIETVGNTAVSDEKLLEGVFHKPLNMWSFTDRGGVYHAGYIEQDLRTITKNYADHGYLAPHVSGARVYSTTPAGDTLNLVFDVEDGPLFHLGKVRMVGDLPWPAPQSHSVLGMRPGDAAALKQLDAGVERLLDVWRNRGYASAKAIQDRRTRETQHLLDVNIRIEKGPLTRVGKIKILGDPSTANHVILRDVVVREGDYYSLNALRLSEERLMYTGLFQKVTLRPAPTDHPAVVDVEVEVTEQQTWYFTIAPSYIPGEGLVGIGLLGFRNLFGQAWRFNGQGVISKKRQTGRMDIEDPRVLDTRLSLGGSVHRDRYVYPEFALIRTGGAMTVGYPLVERSQLTMGYSLERLDMERPGPLEGYIGTKRFPHKKRRGSIKLDAAYDLRDNVLFPTRGLLVAAAMEYGGPLFLGELDFMTLTANARFYVPLPYGFVLKSNTAGAVTFVPGGGVVPVSERFYEGGALQSVRGYAWQSITPTTTLGNPYDPGGETVSLRLGGVSRFINNLEIETPPLPVAPVVPIKLFAFLDAGNTWSERERPFFFPKVLLPQREGKQLPLGLMYSVGVGAMLATALFPLRIEFSVPLTRRPTDDQINFFLSAGSPF
jgi:outer membrane protein insertion porin family